MTQIKGNTYPVKDQLKSMGGRWNKAMKCWEVPDAVAEQAIALVPAARANPGRSPRVCRTCGCKINYGVYCGKCEYR